mgnify:CR=1 FL=1
MALDDRATASEQRGDRLALTDALAELAVPAPATVARGNEVAEAAEAVERLRPRAQRRADPFGPLLMTALKEAGAEPEMFLPEYGKDQFEITCRAAPALTAADRPYKKAVPHEKALDILHMEAKDGGIRMAPR